MGKACVNPENPDATSVVSDLGLRGFSSWQVRPQVDAATAEKNRFRTEASYSRVDHCCARRGLPLFDCELQL